MSADKRKRFHRACRLLFEINNGTYPAPSLSGRKGWSRRTPIVRYIVERGMARIVRVESHKGIYGPIRRTRIDTGVPWARGRK